MSTHAKVFEGDGGWVASNNYEWLWACGILCVFDGRKIFTNRNLPPLRDLTPSHPLHHNVQPKLYAVTYLRNADTRGNDPSATSDPDAEGGPPKEGRVGLPRLCKCGAAFENEVLGFHPINLKRDATTPS